MSAGAAKGVLVDFFPNEKSKLDVGKIMVDLFEFTLIDV